MIETFSISVSAIFILESRKPYIHFLTVMWIRIVTDPHHWRPLGSGPARKTWRQKFIGKNIFPAVGCKRVLPIEF